MRLDKVKQLLNLNKHSILIGQGGQSAIYKVYDRLHKQHYCLKIARPDCIKRINKEYNFLKRLNHPNIIKPITSNYENGAILLPLMELDANKYLSFFQNSSEYCTELIQRQNTPLNQSSDSCWHRSGQIGFVSPSARLGPESAAHHLQVQSDN